MHPHLHLWDLQSWYKVAFECGSAGAASPISEGRGEPGRGSGHPASLQNTQPAPVPAPLQPWGPVMGRAQALWCTPTGLRGRHPKMGCQLHDLKWLLLKKLRLCEFMKLWYSAMFLFSFGVQHMLGEGSALQARSLLYRHIARCVWVVKSILSMSCKEKII